MRRRRGGEGDSAFDEARDGPEDEGVEEPELGGDLGPPPRIPPCVLQLRLAVRELRLGGGGVVYPTGGGGHFPLWGHSMLRRRAEESGGGGILALGLNTVDPHTKKCLKLEPPNDEQPPPIIRSFPPETHLKATAYFPGAGDRRGEGVT